MIVDFKIYNSIYDDYINKKVKEDYELYIQYLAREKFNFINTSKLEKIVITKDFMEDVKKFQKSLGISPSVTNNRFFKAYGKTFHNKENDKYYIFIDYEKGMFLMSDDLQKNSFKYLDEKQTNVIKTEKQIALNLLAHELSHVEFETKIGIAEFDETLDSQIRMVIYNLFSEYYACRRSAAVSSKTIALYDEQTIKKLEKEIIREKWRYKTNKIRIDDFCHIFHEYTALCMISVSCILGNQYKENTNCNIYKDCKVNKVAKIFEKEFATIYSDIKNREKIFFNSHLEDTIMRYYESFGVYPSQKEQGIYYYIP